jgi:GT2 family glycosyltransferase
LPAPRITAIVPATDGPPTLARCVRAIRAAADGPDQVIVVGRAAAPGPAAARSQGVEQATGDVLVFVDSDVLVHPDAFSRVRRAFAADPSLTALFGSYDDAPRGGGVVSAFRDLLHHHVHHQSAGPAATFWAGLGAIRREAYLAARGFDSDRYPTPSIEDVELGMRLHRDGARIELDPAVLGTHLKRWTLARMVRTDLLARGVPWVALLLRERSHSTALNLGWRHRVATATAVGVAWLAANRRPLAASCALGAFVLVNRPFHALLWRREGPIGAAVGVALHVIHHLTAAAAIPLGAAAYARERLRDGGPAVTSSRR